MPGTEPTASPSLGAGTVPDPPGPAGETAPGRSRRRWAAGVAALALPFTMLAPWYSLRISARALSGHTGFMQSLTGWQALSGAAVLCLIVTAGVCVLLVARAISQVTGLGADARRAARARIDGGLIAGGGLLCIVALLWSAVSPPGASPGAVAVDVHAGARWGVLLALAVAVALTAFGVQIAAAAGRSLRDRRKPTAGAISSHLRSDHAAHEPAMPEFDFGAPRVDPAPARPGRVTRGRGGSRRTAVSRTTR